MRYLVFVSLLLHNIYADNRSNLEFLNDRYEVVKERVTEDLYQNNRMYIDGKEDSYYRYTHQKISYFNATDIFAKTKELSIAGIVSSPSGISIDLTYYLYDNLGFGINALSSSGSSSRVGAQVVYNIPLFDAFTVKLNGAYLYNKDFLLSLGSSLNYFWNKDRSLFVKLNYVETPSGYETKIGAGVSFYFGNKL